MWLTLSLGLPQWKNQAKTILPLGEWLFNFAGIRISSSPLLEEFAKALNKPRYNGVDVGEPLFISIAIDAAAIPKQEDPAPFDNATCAKMWLNLGM